MYQALSHPPNKFEGHIPRPDIYRKSSNPRDGIFRFRSNFTGVLISEDGVPVETDVFQIGYTVWGDKGPLCLLLHGVPTNRRAKLRIQELLSPFCRTIAIDMLGMGDSDTSKPQHYGMNKKMGIRDGNPNDPKAWDWVHDCGYIKALMDQLYPGEKFFFQADDWGSGIASHYAALYSEDLLGLIQVDPIAFDGYPVSEIQAFGRASMIPITIEEKPDGRQLYDAKFKTLMGSADQTMVQIFKTMVYDPNVYNQYNLRDIKLGYVDVDYERKDANSVTLELKYNAMRTLCERAAILSPTLLLPYDKEKNPRGVRYDRFPKNVLIIWGAQDNMMPHNQIWRFKNVLTNSRVQTTTIDRAGHFVETDQPEQVVETMIDFMSGVVGIGNMGDIFLGYKGIWKGDEREMIADLRRQWNL